MFGLDAQQQRAIDAGATDLCIGAGAGSGKTRVLTARFVSAVLGVPPYAQADPAELLTVTFTDKAAAELAERIRLALSAAGRHDAARRTGDAWISTIHTMCARILRQYAFEAGVDPRFRVLDDVEAAVVESEAFESALAEVMEHPGVEALLDAYDVRTLRAAARDIRSGVRALGLDLGAVRALSAEVSLKTLAETGRELSEIASALRGRPRIATVEACESAVTAMAALVEDLVADSGVERLEAATRELVTTSMTRRTISDEAYRPLAERAHELVAVARECVAQLLVRDFEQSMVALLSAFDRRYEDMKRAGGALDFEDLQVATARLLESRPDVAAEVRARFSMVMIDEFQDTNELQLSIVERLSDGALCTVGDENQSI